MRRGRGEEEEGGEWPIMAIVVGHDIKFPVEVVRNFTNREGDLRLSPQMEGVSLAYLSGWEGEGQININHLIYNRGLN